MMTDLIDFYDHGFGWTCRHCERTATGHHAATDGSSRLMSEGEAESKQPKMSNAALAKWLDPARTTLVCPQCGISERVDPF